MVRTTIRTPKFIEYEVEWENEKERVWEKERKRIHWGKRCVCWIFSHALLSRVCVYFVFQCDLCVYFHRFHAKRILTLKIFTIFAERIKMEWPQKQSRDTGRAREREREWVSGLFRFKDIYTKLKMLLFRQNICCHNTWINKTWINKEIAKR